ncbi:MAG: DUF2924 domain-containing protein [Chloroflexi bacterium]|nr:DUF2924 domain-containing protein [Chloroflexota bacterium]
MRERDLTPISDRNLRDGQRLGAFFHGQPYQCVVEADGYGLRFRLEDGRLFDSISAAATEVCGHNNNGWRFWKLLRGPGTQDIPATTRPAIDGALARRMAMDRNTRPPAQEPPLLAQAPSLPTPRRITFIESHPGAVDHAISVAKQAAADLPTEDDLAAALETLVRVGVPLARIEALFKESRD